MGTVYVRFSLLTLLSGELKDVCCGGCRRSRGGVDVPLRETLDGSISGSGGGETSGEPGGDTGSSNEGTSFPRLESG